jgi:D-psicose/D-tagatose/L-ribulose 3-epimerase
MHMSMHNWMRSEPLDVTLARLARFGYESIEIKGEPDQYDTKTVRAQLDHYGLRCWGAVTLTLGDRNLCASDEAQRAASVQYVKDCVTMVKELEGEEITIVPSTVGKIVPDGTPEQEWQWAIESLTQIHGHADAAGVRMALEPLNRFETHFLNRAAQALALAEAVAPNVGVCLDAFHMNIEEVDLLEAIRSVGPKLNDFHVADNNRLAAGMGALDWPSIVATLQEIGYDGALTSEFVAPIDRTPANPYPDAIETEPVDITPEEMQFIIDHGSSLLSESFYSMLVERTAQTILPLIQ